MSAEEASLKDVKVRKDADGSIGLQQLVRDNVIELNSASTLIEQCQQIHRGGNFRYSAIFGT